MKRIVLTLFVFSTMLSVSAQDELKAIKLNEPNLKREGSVMQALKDRKSTREFAEKKLSVQDLSDLLWAANGINREDGKRTAPSAMNKQDIDVYVCMEEGSYLYNPKENLLAPVSKGDVREKNRNGGVIAPVMLVLVSKTSDNWAALDAGIVSQNISIFCAAAKLATVPRGGMSQEVLKKALKLQDPQTLQLNHPVGSFKEETK